MDQIRINVNGIEKLASGLNKQTTVQDIKFAMLYSSGSKITQDFLNEYGLFEQWQSNERLLDNNVKMYKIIKMWKQVPGDQLAQVKFLIKKKLSKSSDKPAMERAFKLCSLSPSVQKSWNRNVVQNGFKSSYVKRQMEKLNCQFDQEDRMSINSVPSSAWSSANDESDQDDVCEERTKRYASVRRNIRTRNSSIKRISQNVQEQKMTKLDELQQLKCQLNQIKQELVKAKQTSSDVEKMKSQLRKIDHLIEIKSSLISSLEKELQRLSSIDSTKYCLSSTNSASSISSADTGISSAQSEDETCFETLV